jgi:hypothetical protein
VSVLLSLNKKCWDNVFFICSFSGFDNFLPNFIPGGNPVSKFVEFIIFEF